MYSKNTHSKIVYYVDICEHSEFPLLAHRIVPPLAPLLGIIADHTVRYCSLLQSNCTPLCWNFTLWPFRRQTWSKLTLFLQCLPDEKPHSFTYCKITKTSPQSILHKKGEISHQIAGVPITPPRIETLHTTLHYLKQGGWTVKHTKTFYCRHISDAWCEWGERNIRLD